MIGFVLKLVHVLALSLWSGGLFAYVVIVWPAIFAADGPGFPRAQLAVLAVKTGPWIYLAMGAALLSFVTYWIGGFGDFPTTGAAIYGAALIGLIANNVYGSLISWPKMMLSAENVAMACWRVFYLRMFLSLVVALAVFSIAVVAP